MLQYLFFFFVLHQLGSSRAREHSSSSITWVKLSATIFFFSISILRRALRQEDIDRWLHLEQVEIPGSFHWRPHDWTRQVQLNVRRVSAPRIFFQCDNVQRPGKVQQQMSSGRVNGVRLKLGKCDWVLRVAHSVRRRRHLGVGLRRGVHRDVPERLRTLHPDRAVGRNRRLLHH